MEQKNVALKPYFGRNGSTFYHEDCREILQQFDAEQFDMVLADPL